MHANDSIRGLFCVFEGLDGSGKSTLLERVARELKTNPQARERFRETRLLQEPTNSPEGLAIRKRLKESSDADPARWLEYFLSDRAWNVEYNIAPAVTGGDLVLQDRYFYSTAAYQGVADGKRERTGDDASIMTPGDIVADSRARGFPPPDLLVYLDIPPEIALERIDRNRGAREVFERLDRLEAIARRYAAVLPENTLRLDARRDPEALTADVVTAILEHI